MLKRFQWLCLLLLVGFWSVRPSYSSQIYDLGEGLTISQAQLDSIKSSLERTTEVRTFYHWTNLSNVLRWNNQRSIDAGEVAFFNRPTGNLQVYGPGIYMAQTPTSSQGFGVAVIAFHVAGGTYILDSAKASKALSGRILSYGQLSKLGALIPSIRYASSDWWVGNHPEIFKDVRIKSDVNPLIQWNKLDSTSLMEILIPLREHLASAPYLAKIEALLSYMDGVSLYRAIKVNPAAPWMEFEPENFERFMQAREELFKLAQENKLESIASRQKLGNGQDAQNWAQKQMNEVLPMMLEKLTGSKVHDESHIRREGIRAGGNYPDQTFLASDAELTEIRKNPYLEVVSRARIGGSGHYVHYFYPDVFHYQKIKDILSADLVRAIEAQSPDRLMQDQKRRHNLNQRLINELLLHVFKKYHQTGLNQEVQLVKMMQELVAIHPFADMNGRTIRLYMELCQRIGGQRPAIHPLADFDLLTTPEKYLEILQKGRTSRIELEQMMLKELVASQVENRMPAYRDLPSWEKIWEALSPVVGKQNGTFTQREFELIRLRRFHELFETKFNQSNDMQAGAGCRTVFSN